MIDVVSSKETLWTLSFILFKLNTIHENIKFAYGEEIKFELMSGKFCSFYKTFTGLHCDQRIDFTDEKVKCVAIRELCPLSITCWQKTHQTSSSSSDKHCNWDNL